MCQLGGKGEQATRHRKYLIRHPAGDDATDPDLARGQVSDEGAQALAALLQFPCVVLQPVLERRICGLRAVRSSLCRREQCGAQVQRMSHPVDRQLPPELAAVRKHEPGKRLRKPVDSSDSTLPTR